MAGTLCTRCTHYTRYTRCTLWHPLAPSGTRCARCTLLLQARLPLEPISLVLDALLPQLQHLQDARADAVADAVAHALRATPLSDLLPPPPPVSVRRYQPNEFSYVWITQVLWGIVYSRNQHLYDARRVRLVQVVQVGQ